MKRNVHLRWTWFEACVVALGALACSNGPSVSDFPTQQAQAVCAKLDSCCASAVLVDAGYGSTVSSCTAQMTSNSNTTAEQNAINKNRLAFHSDTAQQCLDDYGKLSCDQLKSNATSQVPACTSYLQPLVPLGGACDSILECIGGSCTGPTADGGDGVCVPLGGDGSSCVSVTCGQGLYCDESQGDGGSVCAPLLPDDAGCTYNEECVTGGCNQVPTDGGSGTCGPKGGDGTTCFLTTGCSTAGGSEVALLALFVLLARRGRDRCERSWGGSV